MIVYSAGTRLSAHPIQSAAGLWPFILRRKKSGSRATISRAQARFFSNIRSDVSIEYFSGITHSGAGRRSAPCRPQIFVFKQAMPRVHRGNRPASPPIQETQTPYESAPPCPPAMQQRLAKAAADAGAMQFLRAGARITLHFFIDLAL